MRKKNSRRSIALAIIVADVAENGELGEAGIRAYIENRISRDVLRKAMERGMEVRANDGMMLGQLGATS